MPVSNVASSTDSIYLDSTGKSTKKSNSDNSKLTMSDFYSLLAAELQNQSMYDTVDNTEYIAQMAQLSLLSEMESVSQTVLSSTAVSMVGKTVSVSSTDEDGNETTVTGTVDSVRFESGTPYLSVNDSYYELSDVLTVQNEA